MKGQHRPLTAGDQWQAAQAGGRARRDNASVEEARDLLEQMFEEGSRRDDAGRFFWPAYRGTALPPLGG